MNFDEYQGEAVKTAIFHDKQIPGIVYCALKLAGESGEVAEKIGKLYRDHNGELTHEKEIELAKELGDVLWYLANLSELIGMEFSGIAEMNINKLKDRQERGVLGGSGDDR